MLAELQSQKFDTPSTEIGNRIDGPGSGDRFWGELIACCDSIRSQLESRARQTDNCRERIRLEKLAYYILVFGDLLHPSGGGPRHV